MDQKIETMEMPPELVREFRDLVSERVRVETAAIRRRMRILGWMAVVIALLAAAGAGGVLYYAFYHGLPILTSPSIRTREVVLMGENGSARGYWRVDDEGTARFVMTDPRGVDRLKLTLRANGEQGVSLADSTGAARVVLGFLDDQSGTLGFADERGQTRGVFGLTPDGESSLLFADQNGGTRAVLGVRGDGSPEFWWPALNETQGDSAGGS